MCRHGGGLCWLVLTLLSDVESVVVMPFHAIYSYRNCSSPAIKHNAVARWQVRSHLLGTLHPSKRSSLGQIRQDKTRQYWPPLSSLGARHYRILLGTVGAVNAFRDLRPRSLGPRVGPAAGRLPVLVVCLFHLW